MSDEAFFGTAKFSLSAALAPWQEPSDYVHEVRGEALVMTGDDNKEQAGLIAMTLVSATEAENKGVSLFDICEDHSSILEQIYSTLFDAKGEPQPELDIEPVWSNLLMIDSVHIKPAYADTPLQVQLIDAAIAAFCPEGLVVAFENALDLSIEDWRRLGFQRIAGSPLVLRDQLKTNPYERQQNLNLFDGSLDDACYTCDGCGEEIVVPIDLSQGASQRYVEDCPICCQANVIHVLIDEDGRARVWAEPEQDYE